MRTKKRRAGLSLIELIVVLIIVAIVLVGFGASASVQVRRASRSNAENELNVMASNLSDAYYDLGNPSFDPTTDEGKTRFQNFLTTLGVEYLGCSFDMSTITPTTNGFYVEISEPLDPYEQPYKCWFVTSASLSRYAMICSGGDNTIVEQAGYANGDYSDDIVLVVYPKVGDAIPD